MVTLMVVQSGWDRTLLRMAAGFLAWKRRTKEVKDVKSVAMEHCNRGGSDGRGGGAGRESEDDAGPAMSR